jgi:hypothetical protein
MRTKELEATAAEAPTKSLVGSVVIIELLVHVNGARETCKRLEKFDAEAMINDSQRETHV